MRSNAERARVRRGRARGAAVPPGARLRRRAARRRPRPGAGRAGVKAARPRGGGSAARPAPPSRRPTAPGGARLPHALIRAAVAGATSARPRPRRAPPPRPRRRRWNAGVRPAAARGRRRAPPGRGRGSGPGAGPGRPRARSAGRGARGGCGPHSPLGSIAGTSAAAAGRARRPGLPGSGARSRRPSPLAAQLAAKVSPRARGRARALGWRAPKLAWAAGPGHGPRVPTGSPGLRTTGPGRPRPAPLARPRRPRARVGKLAWNRPDQFLPGARTGRRKLPKNFFSGGATRAPRARGLHARGVAGSPSGRQACPEGTDSPRGAPAPPSLGLWPW